MRTESRLDDGVQGSRAPSYLITWTNTDGAPVDLTGATLSGTIHSRRTNIVRAIVGALVVTDAPGGAFRWDFASADVAEAGRFAVQFTATFAAGPSPGISFEAAWDIEARQIVAG